MTIRAVSSEDNTKLQNIRRVMLGTGAGGSHEIFRVVNSNTGKILYAKGKIKFDFNPVKDGSGEEVTALFYKKETIYYNSTYAFYNDGFYYRENDVGSNNPFFKWKEQKLSKIFFPYWIEPSYNPDNSPAAKFLGWFTKKEGGRKIDTIQDVATWTNLFNYKSGDFLTMSIPQITLYAHWQINTYTITVHNITKSYSNYRSTSSFEYNGQRTTGSVTFRNVPWGTEINLFLSENIKNPKYVSWASGMASDLLSSSSTQNTFKRGVQKFLGWAMPYSVETAWTWGAPWGYKSYAGDRQSGDSSHPLINGVVYYWEAFKHDDYYIRPSEGLLPDNVQLTRNIDVYPQFEPLVVYQKINANGIYYQGGYRCLNRSAGFYDIKDPSCYAPTSIQGLYWNGYTLTYNQGGKYLWKYLYCWKERLADYGYNYLKYIPYSSTIIVKLVKDS